jgi:ankyrin repeat protein
MNLNYQKKYLKYKTKYLELKNQMGGVLSEESKLTLKIAIESNDVAKLKEILIGKDPNEIKIFINTDDLLIHAINNKHNDIVKELIIFTVPVNNNNDWSSLLVEAFLPGNFVIFKFLLDHSINPNTTLSIGDTPAKSLLYYSIIHNQTEFINELLLHCIDTTEEEKSMLKRIHADPSTSTELKHTINTYFTWPTSRRCSFINTCIKINK